MDRELMKQLCAAVFKNVHAHPAERPVALTINVAKIAEWQASMPSDIVNNLLQNDAMLESALGYENFCMSCVEKSPP